MGEPTIWKYQLQAPENMAESLEVPASSRALSVIEQYGQTVLYVYVPDKQRSRKEQMVIFTATTGGTPPDIDLGWRFLGTTAHHTGQYILHHFVRNAGAKSEEAEHG